MDVYSISLTIIAVCAISLIAVIVIREDYFHRLLCKIGLAKPKSSTNWAVFSWTNMIEKLNYNADVVFFGDSITRGSDFAKSFSENTIVNLGYSGDTISGMKNRVSMLKPLSPEKIFVMGGINGLTDYNIASMSEQYEELLDTIIKELPTSEIYVQSVLPISHEKERRLRCHNTTIANFNKRIENAAIKRNLTFIDLYSYYFNGSELKPELTIDGIHLRADAYQIWTDKIRMYINTKSHV